MNMKLCIKIPHNIYALRVYNSDVENNKIYIYLFYSFINYLNEKKKHYYKENKIKTIFKYIVFASTKIAIIYK